jgi:hypothetical protein
MDHMKKYENHLEEDVPQANNADMILIKWVNISLKRAEKSEREKSGHS